jgi:hypothetical protein
MRTMISMIKRKDANAVEKDGELRHREYFA